MPLLLVYKGAHLKKNACYHGLEMWQVKITLYSLDTFELWCWRRLLRVLWTARSNQSILKEIYPEYLLEGLMLKPPKFGHLMQRLDSLEKTLMLGKTEGKRARKEATDDKMVGWHHWFNGHEFEQTLGDSKGQGSLACCSSWPRFLLKYIYIYICIYIYMYFFFPDRHCGWA